MTPHTSPSTPTRDPGDPNRYVPPSGRGDRWFGAAVRRLTAWGLPLFGSRVLTVTGRRSGLPRSVPVNLLVLDGERYLVSPRGRTEWVRNARASGSAQLRVGRRVEQVTLTELPVGDRLPVLRRYLQRWGWEVGAFVDGLTRDATDAELTNAAPGFPVFRVRTRR